MSDFTKTTNFTAKDSLSTGDPNKVIKGATFDTEFDALATSSATKANKIVSGVTSNVIKQSAGGDLVDSGYSFSGLVGDTAVTKAEVDILDGLTSTTAQLNLLGGVTALSSTDDVIDNFPAGTRMLFQQAAAPTGWTRDVTAALNDHALRIVTSGTFTAGTLGTSAFSTVFGKTATDSYTLLTADIPSHTHGSAGAHTHTVPHTTAGGSTGSGISGDVQVGANYAASSETTSSSGAHTHASVGGSGGHSHNMDIRVKYLDMIVASKD